MSEVQSTTQISAAEVEQVAGGDGSVTVGTNGVQVGANGASPTDALISMYEGFVDVTSHIMGRIADAMK